MPAPFSCLPAIALCLTLSLSAQPPTGGIIADPPDGPLPWTQLDFNDHPDRFQFAIVTDRTGGHRPGVFMEGVRRLNLLQPEFVMSVGDLIEGYTEDTDELTRQWEEFDGFVDQLEMPFFYVPGNHDITNKVMEDMWKERYGPTHYAFTYHDVLFMCLNSEDQYRGASRGSISDEQYTWIQETLAKHTDVRWTLLFMHQPLWVQEMDPVRWFDVEALLRDRPHTVFVGHRHHYVKYERNNGKYFLLATTGGGSRLRGPELGEFDHVVWITMTEQGPIIANLELSGIWDEDVVTEQTQAFIDEVEARNPFQLEPLYFEDEAFTGGTLRLRITNDADVPMHVHLRNAFSWDLHSSLSQAELEINPNDVAFTEVELAPRREANQTGPWAPVALEGSYRLGGEDSPKLEFPFRYLVAPEQRYQLPRRTSQVTVDGELGEWEQLAHFVGPETSPEDGSLRFALAYDDTHLYVAAEVQDDDVQADTSATLWQQDFVGLLLNAEPLRQSAMASGGGRYRGSVYLLMGPTPDGGRSMMDERLPEGSDWTCRPTEQGYVLEMALPLEYVRQQQGDAWETVRLNMAFQDSDADAEETPRYFFQPDWNGNANRPGSGMFFRKMDEGDR